VLQSSDLPLDLLKLWQAPRHLCSECHSSSFPLSEPPALPSCLDQNCTSFDVLSVTVECSCRVGNTFRPLDNLNCSGSARVVGVFAKSTGGRYSPPQLGLQVRQDQTFSDLRRTCFPGLVCPFSWVGSNKFHRALRRQLPRCTSAALTLSTAAR